MLEGSFSWVLEIDRIGKNQIIVTMSLSFFYAIFTNFSCKNHNPKEPALFGQLNTRGGNSPILGNVV